MIMHLIKETITDTKTIINLCRVKRCNNYSQTMGIKSQTSLSSNQQPVLLTTQGTIFDLLATFKLHIQLNCKIIFLYQFSSSINLIISSSYSFYERQTYMGAHGIAAEKLRVSTKELESTNDRTRLGRC